MNKLTKILFLIFAFQLISSTSFAAKHVIRWKINHTPVKYFVSAVNTFKKHVEKETNGEVTVVAVMPENNDVENIDNSALLNDVKTGQVEMAQVYTSIIAKSLSKKFNVFDLPFLFENHKHATKVMDHKIGNQLLASLDNSGVKGLGFTYSGGFLVQASNGKTVHKYEDMKGTKNKTFGGYLTTESLKKLGAYEVATIENRRSVSSSQVDLHSSTYADLKNVFNKHSKRPKLINETNHRLLATTLVINENFYRALPKNLQSAVKKAARISAIEERLNIVNESKNVKQMVLEKKIPIIKVSKLEQRRWRTHLQPVYEKFYKDVKGGRSLVQKIQSVSAIN